MRERLWGVVCVSAAVAVAVAVSVDAAAEIVAGTPGVGG